MIELRPWLERGEEVALATVVATRHSAPRPVGAKLAVAASGELAGSVSGGCVESEAYEHARDVLDGASPRLVTFGITDEQALDVGLPCGGEIDVYVWKPQRELAELIASGERAVVRIPLDGSPPEAVDEPLRKPELRGDAFFDVLGPRVRVVIVGAVDVAEHVCRAARPLGWWTTVVDPRAKLATRERLPSADEIDLRWPEDAFDDLTLDADTAVVVLAHDDRFDIPALTRALASPAFYVGALGSRRNQARRREVLLEAGVPEDAVARIAGPCGLDLGAETPAEIALSIVAEILAARNERGATSLREGSGRIHAAA